VQRRIQFAPQRRLSSQQFCAVCPRIGARFRGISLLETLAALVILSAGTAVMLTWFSQNATALTRLKDAESIEQGRLIATEYVRAINPVDQPSGDITIDSYRISWSSRQIAANVRALNGSGSPGRYEISLHELKVNLARVDITVPEKINQITLPVVGYRLVAPATNGIFGTSAVTTTP
jgi:general secretion pathway protein I